MSRTTIDFGIDLGTTNSAIAHLRGSIVDVVKNNLDADATPSAVYIDKRGQVRVGSRAKDRIADDRSAEDVYVEFKRRMGTDFVYEFNSANRSLLPEEVSAEVLKSLRGDVQQRLGEDITAAVITVPAIFEQRQCAATIKAGNLAGFKQCALLQEPVAAALAYGFQADVTKEYWLIYDFGGGTFDAALIKAEDGSISVVNHGGDNYLGGADIDYAVMDGLIIPELAANYNLPDFSRNNRRWKSEIAKVKRSLELAKIQLSRSETAFLEDCRITDADGDEIEVEIKLTRNQLVDSAEPIILRSAEICKRVLAEKSITNAAIGRMVLVGGPTLAPWFRDILADHLEVPLDFSVDPLTVVARGAAVFAGTQRIESHAMPKAQSGSFGVKCVYSAMGPDTDPKVRGEVSSPDGTATEGFAVEFVNVTEDAAELSGWTSGRITLRDGGKFSTRLNAEKSKRNVYRIDLFDATGAKQKVEPENIEYTVTGGVGIIAEQPFCNDISIALADNSRHVCFKKGDAYPANHAYRKFKTTRVVKKGDSAELLRIPVVEGSEDKADWNPVLGALVITGNHIRRDVPVDSEIEVTISAKQPGELLVKAYIPFLDEEFEVLINYDRDTPDAEPLHMQYTDDAKRLAELQCKAEETDDPEAHALIDVVPDVESIENLIDLAKGDPDSAKKAQKRLIELRQAIDKVEDRLKWPSLVAEVNTALDELDRMAEAHGTDAQVLQAEALRSEAEKLIDQNRADPLNRKLEQIRELNSAILLDQDGFWVGYFSTLIERKNNMNDPAHADQLINQGRQCINTGNSQGLRNVVMQLHRMLPQNVAEEVAAVVRGHGSGIIK